MTPHNEKLQQALQALGASVGVMDEGTLGESLIFDIEDVSGSAVAYEGGASISLDDESEFPYHVRLPEYD